VRGVPLHRQGRFAFPAEMASGYPRPRSTRSGQKPGARPEPPRTGRGPSPARCGQSRVRRPRAISVQLDRVVTGSNPARPTIFFEIVSSGGSSNGTPAPRVAAYIGDSRSRLACSAEDLASFPGSRSDAVDVTEGDGRCISHRACRIGAIRLPLHRDKSGTQINHAWHWSLLSVEPVFSVLFTGLRRRS
jgi:hypothetical protein